MPYQIHTSNMIFLKKYSVYRICRNKRPGRLISRSNKKHSKPHQKPSVLCTPPFEKSPIKSHRFCVLPPLKNHPSKATGFVYSPLWEITHQSPSVLCTPPFEKSLFLVGAYFGVGVYFGKYAMHKIVRSWVLEWNIFYFRTWVVMVKRIICNSTLVMFACE